MISEFSKRYDMASELTSQLTTIAEKDQKERSETNKVPKKHKEWKVNVAVPPKIVAPSFIRLFVIRRILSNCIVGIDKTDEEIDKEIKNVVKVINDDAIEQVLCIILHQLLNHDLKSYMKNYYNEQKQATTIEIVFNEVILNMFAKEYRRITRYVSTSNKKEDRYKCLVFNTCDLMYLIFQFLDFWNINSKLHNCSLVTTHWLYQIWDSTWLYHAY